MKFGTGKNESMKQQNQKWDATGKGRKGQSRAAFTLIELLTVIAIIGILAALIIPISGLATAKMRIGRVQAELNALVTMIESYKHELGGYPPDHGLLSSTPTNQPLWRIRLQRNPLFYELGGAVFTNNVFRTLTTFENVTPAQLQGYFSLNGIQNSARVARDVPYRAGDFKASQHKKMEVVGGDYVEMLVVPVPGPQMLPAQGGGTFNGWFYDASSTNRHNRKSFDLWAEINVRGDVQVIGNWAQ